MFSSQKNEEKINNEEQFLRDLKDGNKEFLNNKIRKNTSLLGTIKNILLGCIILGSFTVLIVIIFFYYNQELLKNLLNSFSVYLLNNNNDNPYDSTPNVNNNESVEYEHPKSSKDIKKEELDEEIREMEERIKEDEINKQVEYETNINVNNNSEDYVANDTETNNGSVVNSNKFCYIGEDRGYRSCIELNSGDTCMSGDIFPSMDICINPNLRT